MRPLTYETETWPPPDGSPISERSNVELAS